MTISTADYLQELFGLDGLTAVVIGGTGVLGGAFCDALGAAGAHVVVAGRSAERGEARAEAIVAGGGSAEFQPVDNTSREDFQAIVSHLSEAGRRPDIVINGACLLYTSPSPRD